MNEVYQKSKDFFEKAVRDKNKSRKILLIVGSIGVLLILLSEIKLPESFQNNSHSSEISGNYADYTETLNADLTDIISSINGVGECKLMITLKNTNEKVYAQNSDNSYSESSNSKNNEYVIYESENGDSPILLKEKYPQVEGVAVVCSGGGNSVVRESVIQCVCALFNIPASRVSVSKISNEG